MKTWKVLVAICLTMLLSNSVYAANIDNISVSNSHTIQLEMSEDIALDNSVEWDFKILKDILVSFVTKDYNDSNKLILTLDEDLEANTAYSLLGIYGVDGNMEFHTPDMLNGVEIMNKEIPTEQGILRIIIQDTRTLEVFFQAPLEEEEFDFKLFNELAINKVEYTGGQTLSLTTKHALPSNSQFMLMALNITDALAQPVLLDEDLHNFETLDAVAPSEELIEEEAEKNLEEMALNAAETPDTGAETWVLVFLTLLVHGAFITRKKLMK